jgi:catechol 2,3-dioxygenase-like lactoylglutathione lyase family enzyme
MIKNFRHACVMVKDLKRSLRFYKDILGFKVFKVLAVEGAYPETVLGIKGIRLTYVKMWAPGQTKRQEPVFELHCWRRPRLPFVKGYNHISLTVDNMEREYKRLKGLGVKFISVPIKAPHGYTKICFAYDPDKNLIEFVEEVK